jgi:hypothetical protein
VNDPKATAEQWAASVAAVAVDAPLDAWLVPREQFEAACAIVAAEVFGRLCVHHYPPPVDYDAVGEVVARLPERRQAERGAAADPGRGRRFS